jgi:hypothetical protein
MDTSVLEEHTAFIIRAEYILSKYRYPPTRVHKIAAQKITV